VSSYKDDVRKHLLAAIDRIAKAEAAAAGAPKPPKMEVLEGTNAVYNDPALTRRISGALVKALGASNVAEAEPTMGAEDFSFMLEARPGAFIFIGNGDSAGLHHPSYDFNDDVLPYGMSYWVELVETALAP